MMTNSYNERFYDEHVAPALAELAKECYARGMNFVAVVEYEPEVFGLTESPSTLLTRRHTHEIAKQSLSLIRCGTSTSAKGETT